MLTDLHETLKNAKKIAILSHINPDCDTIGSALALFNALRYNYRCEVVCLDTLLPRKMDFVAGYEKIKHTLSPNVDVIIACDAGDLARLGLEEKPCFMVNIDHHITNTHFGDINYIDANTPATGCVMYRFLQEMDFKIGKDVATALYASILDDSKYFTTDRVTARTFETVSTLIEIGIDPSKIAKLLKRREPLAGLRLRALAYNSLELSHNAQVAKITLSKKDFEQSGAEFNLYKDIIEDIISLSTVKVAIAYVYQDTLHTKVSLRSKETDLTNIAALFNGGGHPYACGYTLQGDQAQIDANEAQLKDALATVSFSR